jgi:Rha family phage regulatory protein
LRRSHLPLAEENPGSKYSELYEIEVFRKKHGKIIGKIEDIQCSQGFSQANFGLAEYEDSHGRKQPMYEMTRDGFSFF